MTTQPLGRTPAPARRTNRACPLASAWARLVEFLPVHEQKGASIAPRR